MTTDANIIKIKRSGTSGAPSSLKLGELAYSYLAADGNPTNNGGDRLFIGANGVDPGTGNANDIIVIGGKYFTDLLDHTRGTLTASSALIADGNSVIDRILTTGLNIGGISGGGLDYTISTDNNNDLVLSTGTGKVSINGAYTLPNADGTAGYVLTTNGSGVVSWAAAVASLTVDAGTGGPQTVNLLTDTLTTVSADGNISTAVDKSNTTVTTTLTLSSDLTINSVSSLTGTGAVELTSSPDGTTLHTWLLNTDGTTSFNNDAYIFPAADGTSGYVLTTDGAGNVTWGTPWTSAGYQTSGDVSTAISTALTGYAQSSDTLYVGTTAVTLNQASGTVSALTGINSISSAANTGNVTINASGAGNTWSFNTDGNIVLPGGGLVSRTGYSDTSTVSALWATDSYAGLDWKGTNTVYVDAFGIEFYTNSSGTGYTSGAENYWGFGADGKTYFPNYNFPNAHGTSGQVLVDDGNGNLSWGTPASSFTVTGTTGSETFNITSDTLNTVSGNSNLSVAVTKDSTTVISTVTLASTLTGLTEVDVGDLILSGNTIENGSNGTGDVSLVANNGGGDKTFTFGGDGGITLPQGGFISEDSNAYNGSIKLKPSGGSTSTQALVIYPTVMEGDHIHLTADGGTTDLYLGSDSQFVKVDHSGPIVVGTNGNSTLRQWTFGTDGTTAFPNFTFPSANGTTGQVLTADAATGLLSWTTLSQSFYIGTTQITTGNASGSVTTIAGLTEVDVGDLVLSGSTVSTASDTGDVNIIASTTHGDQTWTFDGNGVLTLPMSGTITNVPNPVNPNEVANKAYVDATASGLKIHQPVTVATTAALSTIGGTVSYADGNDIASPSVGSTLSFTTPITVLDGYTFQGDERILVKDQVNATQNGVYVYTSSTSWTRATDFDHAGLISGADFMFVEDGVKNGSTGWVQTDQNITSIGATGSDITFVQFSAANSYVAGDGVQITGNSIAVKLATNSGLSTSSGSLTISGIAGTAATTGLTYSAGVLQVGTDGTSIGINASGYLEIKSTWSGQSAITTVGTISSGTWQGNAVTEAYGGTGQTTYAKGDILYASSSNTLSKLAAGTNGQTIQLQGGVPVWADLDGGTY